MRGCLRRLPAFSVVAEDFGTAACLPVQCDIELLLGNVDAKPGGNSHFHVLADVRERSRAVPAVRQPCTGPFKIRVGIGHKDGVQIRCHLTAKILAYFQGFTNRPFASEKANFSGRRSSAKCSVRTRLVVAWTRTLAP